MIEAVDVLIAARVLLTTEVPEDIGLDAETYHGLAEVLAEILHRDVDDDPSIKAFSFGFALGAICGRRDALDEMVCEN